MNVWRHKAAWDHFSIHVVEEYKKDRYRNMTIEDVIEIELKIFNGKNVIHTAFIEFDKEEDALAFVLKFS